MEINKIYYGDCLQILRRFPDNLMGAKWGQSMLFLGVFAVI